MLVSAMGVLVAYKALSRWGVELRWKRKEALFNFVDSFLDTPGAQNAMMMLHTKSREVPLWDKGTPEDRWVRVTWDDVSAAFTPNRERELPVEPFDTAIRDCFGDFFGRLTRLQLMREEDILQQKHIDFIMKHWKDVFSRDFDCPHMRNIRVFLHTHQYDRIVKLFRSVGFDLEKQIETDMTQLFSEVGE